MKISVVFITYNRKEDLKRSILGFQKQTYRDKEIIVVDNASMDGTREMMAEEFPDIKYLWLPDNFDIRSINIGVEMASGDIIWRTDDDSFPESEDAFEKVVGIFKNNPDIHIISTEDIEVRKGGIVWEWYPFKVDKENIPKGGYPANVFPGTGAAIKKEVFDKVGGFWEFGFEEIDFCTKAIAAGFNVRYFPNIRTLHYASPAGRLPGTRWVKISKQYIRYQMKYFPIGQAIGRAIQVFFFQQFVAIYQRIPFTAYIEGVFGMISVAFGTYREERQPVPAEKLHDITLGVSLFRSNFKFITEVIRKNLNKWRKK